MPDHEEAAVPSVPPAPSRPRPPAASGGTVTVVTGPAGVDTAPVVVHLARHLDDGLAIRVTDPFANPDRPASVRRPLADGPALYVLPSIVFACPDANLGVVGGSRTGIQRDIEAVEQRGATVRHRLHVDSFNGERADRIQRLYFDGLGEVGDLAVHARDSVLRMGDHVFVEAADGQTVDRALDLAGAGSWLPYVRRVDRWVCVDVAAVLDAASTTGPDVDRHTAVRRAIHDEVIIRNGGPVVGTYDAPRVALINIDAYMPELAGVDNQRLNDEESVPDRVVDVLNSFTKYVYTAFGVTVDLLTTGRGTVIDLAG